MSNPFKHHSRFSCLMESEDEIRNERRNDHRKDERPKNRYERRQLMKEKEKEKEMANKEKDIFQIDHFPELATTSSIQVLSSCDYIDKVKTVIPTIQDISIQDPDLVGLEYGWVFMKKDKTTGKTVTKSLPKSETVSHKEDNDAMVRSRAIDACIELHERRTQEYIDLNGYDTWEKQFKCRNWMEWEAEYEDEDDEDDEDGEEDDEEDEYNNDDYENYWYY